MPRPDHALSLEPEPMPAPYAPRPLHAFVDESKRSGQYLMCAVLIAPKHLAEVRRALTDLCLRGQRRLHFRSERDPRRRLILDRIARFPMRAYLYQQSHRPTVARAACMRTMTRDFLAVGVSRLVIEHTDGYLHRDGSVLINEMQRQGWPNALVYEHVQAHLEPNLWAADAVAWAYGAGGDWRRRIDGLIDIRP